MLSSIMKHLLLIGLSLILLPQLCYSNNKDEFRVYIWIRVANCTSPLLDKYSILDLKTYREKRNKTVTVTNSTFFSETEAGINISEKKLVPVLKSLFSFSSSKTRLICAYEQEERDEIYLCRFGFDVNGKWDFDHVRKFAFRLFFALYDNYTCCWNFHNVTIDRRYNNNEKTTVTDRNFCVKRPTATCVHSNLNWVCPRTGDKTVFESGVFIGNYTSNSVTYINPVNCDDDQFILQTNNLTKCVFPPTQVIPPSTIIPKPSNTKETSSTTSSSSLFIRSDASTAIIERSSSKSSSSSSRSPSSVSIMIEQSSSIMIEPNSSASSNMIEQSSSFVMIQPSSSSNTIELSSSPNVIEPSSASIKIESSLSNVKSSSLPSIMIEPSSSNIIEPSYSFNTIELSSSSIHMIKQSSLASIKTEPFTSSSMIELSSLTSILIDQSSSNIIEPSSSFITIELPSSPDMIESSSASIMIQPSSSSIISELSFSSIMINQSSPSMIINKMQSSFSTLLLFPRITSLISVLLSDIPLSSIEPSPIPPSVIVPTSTVSSYKIPLSNVLASNVSSFIVKSSIVPLSSFVTSSTSSSHETILSITNYFLSTLSESETRTSINAPSIRRTITAQSFLTKASRSSPAYPTPTLLPSVNVISCDSDDVWESTSPGTNVSLPTGVKECFNGTVEAIRRCLSNGTWGRVQCLISATFKNTLNQIAMAPVEGLKTLSTAMDLSLSQSAILLDKALESALESFDTIDKGKFVDSFLNVTSELILSLSEDEYEYTDSETDSDQSRIVASQLLLSLDDFALTFIEPSEDVVEFSGSFLKVTQIETRLATDDSSIVGIEVGNNSITLPDIIFKDTTTPVRIGSFLFPNLSLLLPPLDTNSSIISPIISSTINCKSCLVTDLTNPVLITLQIENSLDLLSNKENISCVFYDFKNQDGLLPSGDWNTSGCTTEVNGDLVTCSCNHLTHFAILLSPGGPEISPIHYDVLNTIGLVLVPISLLCMVLVILTYTLIRSLWSIRNYIHVMLCASLFMAQLVFIIGVDKIENQGACSAVAVILLYLFLVTFMWMLMEGVVLYVTLVRVFIQNHKYYIIAFTVASYVIPAVYMALVVPIGFLISTENITDHTHFLYYKNNDGNQSSLAACWLNYSTGFIWSFIAPVIVIIMANIGFFIMSISILRKHMKRHKKKFNAKIRHWLKASISLTLVMGIAWLVGVLAFRRELLPVAYIITVFIAGQGILIFIILVPMSKQVREAYVKVWHTKQSQSTLLSKFAEYSFFSSNSMNRTGTFGMHKDKEGKTNSCNGGGIVLGTFETPKIENSVPTDISVSTMSTSIPLPNSHDSGSSFDSIDNVDFSTIGDYTVIENLHTAVSAGSEEYRMQLGKPQYEPTADLPQL